MAIAGERMTLKTSLIITGDGKVAKAAVDALRQSVEQTGASAAKVAPQAQKLDKALDEVAGGAKAASVATDALDAQFRETAAAAGSLGSALTISKTETLAFAGPKRCQPHNGWRRRNGAPHHCHRPGRSR